MKTAQYAMKITTSHDQRDKGYNTSMENLSKFLEKRPQKATSFTASPVSSTSHVQQSRRAPQAALYDLQAE